MTEESRGGVLVLSPHRDDAAFSCGLLIASLVCRGVRVRIANICTVSDYAPYAPAHVTAGDVEEITGLRAREDDEFVALLRSLAAPGSTGTTLLDCAWLDNPLRRGPGGAGETLAVDANEVQELAAYFRAWQPAEVVLAPLAIGQHPDHVLVREAAIAHLPPQTLLFYEDLPYLCRVAAEKRAAEIENALPWSCMTRITAPGKAGLKRRMALCYPSQIAASVAEEMERFAVGADYTERLHGSASALQAFDGIHLMETTGK